MILNQHFRNVSETGLFQEKTLMLGALSTLLSSTFWQISAIYLSLPVSGSHSIVSGLIGNVRDMKRVSWEDILPNGF